MRIAVISDWFSEKMGYAENCLPKALAALGHDVHAVTSDAQVYFDAPDYAATYQPYLGPPVVPCETKELDGYVLHRLPHGRQRGRPWRGRLTIVGLREQLAEIRPEVVQTFDIASPATWACARARRALAYRLFLESHVHASVLAFPASQPRRCIARGRLLLRNWPWCAMIARRSERCYPISSDCAAIARRYFAMPRAKIQICSLGVDDALFHPMAGDADRSLRRQFRHQFGFRDDEVVCIYTGRLSADKGPLIMAQAVEQLGVRGEPFRGLFVGLGPREYAGQVEACRGCVVHPFVPTRDLPPYYWAADIGVWPRQESTSQLDAMATGLPIVLSDRVQVLERVQGNGLLYSEPDCHDLADRLLTLKGAALRSAMGACGAEKVRQHLTWREIARRRVQDYDRP